MKNTVVLYHDDLDGFAGAFAAWLKLRDTAEYRPIQYHETEPDLDTLPTGPEASVIYIDICPSLPFLEQLDQVVGQVLVLDHHVTRKEDIERFGVYGDDLSGCGVAWRHFHPGEPLPWVIECAQAYDLWQWTEEQRALAEYVKIWDRKFSVWEFAMASSRSEAGRVGSFFLGHLRWLAGQQAEKAVRGRLKLTKPEAIVYAVECSSVEMINAVGEAILEKYPDADIAMMYRFAVDGAESYSFRSRVSDEDVDVGELAKQFGGGGHKCAAGCRNDSYQFGPLGDFIELSDQEESEG
ncbi:DHHA1 domain-containing protein [Ruficoccus sp. ZRK36]|uniref:DHHA1 domain-containing protein n=1 Tax=Ruficoccus sp. ZRK36 TaxID=2866311 RepID=UPI001C737E80|nr:DHHA1 domain-containing protein [Ruficoccus sp. ZRK36]QYY35303.1 hypothetical protein K0V07_13505 [Ruficoccus sp. ZRK36]